MKRLVGLAVSIDGGPPVCIACAEKVADEGGFAHLFWMANRPQRVDAARVCACGARMDSERAQGAAGRVANFLKPNSAICVNKDN